MDGEILLETQRTILRNLQVADAGDFYALNRYPEILRFTGDAPFKDVQAAANFLAGYIRVPAANINAKAIVRNDIAKLV